MREPIAIVGVGCRFPGNVERPDDLSRLLVEKRNAIQEIPPERWDANAFFHSDFRKPGYIHVKRHGMLSGVDRFDAAFFGVSPNEAKRMDPQQRFVLETAYRAIEDAGVPLERLAGRNVACIVGAGTVDYGGMLRTPTERGNIGPTSNPGSALSIVSNRVSYTFDLRGPSFTVDTACSSSLTALHYACASIWGGAAEAAIAGGVGLIISPELTMGFSKGGYLSPDAECRAFSDHANGYVRSEGVGAVFLKPLSKALSDGDRIYALVRGTWVNQDGRTQGMTVPSLDAQESLLRCALREASVEPRQIAYLEAHGTGTPAGDPIEANAIGNVVGRASGRTDTCWLGSVKPNLGHMECAAGMGGLVKLALVLRERRVFPNIHFRKANPKIDLDRLGLAIATDDCVPLAKEGPIFGGVNSFGFGGANGHAVLESPPPHRDRDANAAISVPAAIEATAHPFVVSARSAGGLKKLAAALAESVRGDETTSLAAWSSALLARRSRFEFRAGFAASTTAELASTLDALAADGDAPAHVATGRAPEGRRAPVAFVYTGQGAQWFAMGRRLLETNATFQRVVEGVGAKLAALGWQNGRRSDLRDELLRSRETSRMGETRIAQPCIFALQVAVTELLRERGIVPAAVVGHSIGELAAAVAAGALDLDQATRIVHFRSECQASAEGKGAMVAVGMTESEARALIAGRSDIELAALNGPAALTLAGTHDAVAWVVSTLEAKGTFVRKLDVSVPFHCHLMDPVKDDFLARLGVVQARTPEVPFFSTVAGAVSRTPLDAAYWWGNIREPVRYHAALRAMLKSGLSTFVEVGPHPALQHGSKDTIRDVGARAAWVPTLRRDGDDPEDLALAFASLVVHGARETETPVAEHVALPPYPFERERFWLETEAGRLARTMPLTHVHPHLGRFERNVHAPEVFSVELKLDPSVEPYLGDHRAQGHVVVPAVGQLELVVAAGRHVLGDDVNVLEDIELKRPIVVSPDEADATRIRLDVYSDDGSFVIVSNSGKPDAPWALHTQGKIRRCKPPAIAPVDVAALRERAPIEMSQVDFYRDCESVGLELGPAFKNLVEFRRDDARTEVFCAVEPVGITAEDAGRFLLHPTLLDSSVHSLLAGESGRQRLHLPHRLDRIRLFGPPPRGRFYSHARILWSTSEEICGEAELCDESGRVFARFEGLVMHLVRGASEQAATNVLSTHPWREKPRAAGEERPRAGETWLVLQSARAPEAGRAVERRLAASGARIVRVIAGERFERREPHLFEVRAAVREDWEALASAIDAPVSGVVHLFSLDLPSDARPLDAARRGEIAAGHLVTTLKTRERWTKDAAHPPEVWLVTSRATQPAAATLWGFGRVLMSEQPRLAVTLVEIDDASAPSLAAEIAAGPADAEVSLHGERRMTRTLARPERTLGARTLDVQKHAVRAVTRSPGVLDSIALEEFHPKDPGPGEIEIAVRAVGLNFRDVVAAMSLLTRDAWKGGLIDGQQLGLDAAGVVTRVGEGVRDFRVGDELVGFFPHSLGTRAVTKARLCAKLLPGISMVTAAALPTPFGTCDFALNDLAHLGRGETILIHAAAGGVGTIAVQLALSMGARVIATTSSEEKRAFLRSLGVEADHIFQSRTTEFGDGIMELTKGAGVDVVLNSLSGRAMTESMRVLAPFGRFIEIGKTDVYKNRQIGLRQFGENKSYFCLDINRVHSYARVDIPGWLARAMEAVKSGVLHTLPVRTYPLEEAGVAMRHLAQGKQIGRLVVEAPERGEVKAFPSRELRLDPAASYVVTGGCAGFGLAVAEWLTERGATKLVLASRRGLPTAVEERQVTVLRDKGVDVRVVRADVSIRRDVDTVVEAAERQGRLAGVFHAAMVLDDGAIDAMTEERVARVLAPKAEGALHLHDATRSKKLDYFVLLSSIASVLGTPGQSSYAAANAVLDELAAKRRAEGLAGTSINFGVIGDVGVVARADAMQKRRILSHGVRAMSSTRALSVLEHVLHDGDTQAVVADVDARTLARLGGATRRFDEALLAGGASSVEGESLRDALRAAPEEERTTLLVSALGRLVEGVAGLAAGQIDPDASLGRYGFDSMMVAQLQTWIDEQLSLSVAMVRLLRGPSINELASELLAQLAGVRAGAESGASLFRELKKAREPRYRVVCFPPMAIEADAFAMLADAAPADVAVHAMSLPTFSEPNAEVLLAPTDEQIAMLAGELASLGSEPLVLYGHSMGAYFALAVARELLSRGETSAALVVCGAVPIADVPSALAKQKAETFDEVTEAMAEDAVRRFQGNALSLPASERARILELARRDLWLTVRGKEPDPSVPPGQRALLVGGDGDTLTTIDKLGESARRDLGYVADPLRVPGGHLFLLDRAGTSALSALVGEHMAELLGEKAIA